MSKWFSHYLDMRIGISFHQAQKDGHFLWFCAVEAAGNG